MSEYEGLGEKSYFRTIRKLLEEENPNYKNIGRKWNILKLKAETALEKDRKLKEKIGEKPAREFPDSLMDLRIEIYEKAFEDFSGNNEVLPSFLLDYSNEYAYSLLARALKSYEKNDIQTTSRLLVKFEEVKEKRSRLLVKCQEVKDHG